MAIAWSVSSKLNITKYGIQQFDQNSTSKTISLNQTFEEFSENCVNFGLANNLNFSLIYSPHKRISVVELYFDSHRKYLGYENLFRSDALKINLFVSPYSNCISERIPLRNREDWSEYHQIFVCEFNSFEDYNKEIVIPNSMRFSFKSEYEFLLRICKIFVYEFEVDCGFPDLPIGASIRGDHWVHAFSDDYNRTIEILGPSHGKRYRIIGENTLKCTGGYWDKEPPIFEPEIQCNFTNFNLSTYKSIKFENLEFFNETQVAVIDSKVLFQCNNGDNSSKSRVSICNENGSWIGDDFNCKLNSKYLKLKIQLINCIFR